MSGDGVQESGGKISSVNISIMYMVSDRVIVERNQAELSKLEAGTANSVLSLKRLASLPGRLNLKCD